MPIDFNLALEPAGVRIRERTPAFAVRPQI